MTQDEALTKSGEDNPLITEHPANLAAIRCQGIAFPNDFKPRQHADELMLQYNALPAPSSRRRTSSSVSPAA